MDISLKELSAMLNTSSSNLRNYLGRGEFTSKCPLRNGIVRGIEEEQIERLALLLKQRRNRWER